MIRVILGWKWRLLLLPRKQSFSVRSRPLYLISDWITLFLPAIRIRRGSGVSYWSPLVLYRLVKPAAGASGANEPFLSRAMVTSLTNGKALPPQLGHRFKVFRVSWRSLGTYTVIVTVKPVIVSSYMSVHMVGKCDPTPILDKKRLAGDFCFLRALPAATLV